MIDTVVVASVIPVYLLFKKALCMLLHFGYLNIALPQDAAMD
jgi:hypothetical protein